MRLQTVELLRCPYCGGRLTHRDDLFHVRTAHDLTFGILACACAQFPIVSGVAVLTVEGVADNAREQVAAGQPADASRTMFAAGDDDLAERYDTVVDDAGLTYADVVNALGPDFVEGRYFLYRFSDPTFVVAEAVVQALAVVLLADGGRVVDVCGGSGHVTRTLAHFTTAPPVLMDWSFAKLWLARRFTVPHADLVCADAHTALPFRRGAFRLAVCSDAFHYIWSKALLAHELAHVVDDRGAVAVTHVHNALQPNESAGMPLPPCGYRELFEAFGGRVFAESALLEQALCGRIDLGVNVPPSVLDADPALTIVAARREDVFATHAVQPSLAVRGALRINPLYALQPAHEGTELTLVFPSEQYEQEFGHCRKYLPERLTLDRETLGAIEQGGETPQINDLRARRVLLDLPKGFY
jgi:SAM-dependent methyltransferase